jgi:hypothetical protein
MKETLTISKILKVIFSVYLAGSLFYATIHLLGFGWFQTSTIISPSSLKSSQSSLPRSETISVSKLQQKYFTPQQVTWTNAEGKKPQTWYTQQQAYL